MQDSREGVGWRSVDATMDKGDGLGQNSTDVAWVDSDIVCWCLLFHKAFETSEVISTPYALLGPCLVGLGIAEHCDGLHIPHVVTSEQTFW